MNSKEKIINIEPIQFFSYKYNNKTQLTQHQVVYT